MTEIGPADRDGINPAMNWEDLRHFLVLARSGSLSAASRELGVDHTTVARRVAALEASLGLALVDRMPRSYALTAEGARIAELAARLEDDAFAVMRAARGADAAITGTVRVSAPPNLASRHIAPRLVRLHRTHPGLVVELIGAKADADLDRQEADVAVRLSRPTGEHLVARKVGEMAFRVYVAAEGAGPGLITYDDSFADVAQEAWVRRAFAHRPVVARTNDMGSIVEAVRSGLGAAVLPSYIGDADSLLVPLAVPVGAPEPPLRSLYLVVHDDLRKVPRIRAVMEFLAGAIGSELQSGSRSSGLVQACE